MVLSILFQVFLFSSQYIFDIFFEIKKKICDTKKGFQDYRKIGVLFTKFTALNAILCHSKVYKPQNLRFINLIHIFAT